MNARFLYAATVAFALASTLAMADETKPLTRTEVVAQFHDAAAHGALRKSDYDFDRLDTVPGPARARDQVIAETAAARSNQALLGPLRNRSYNPYGDAMLRPSTLARAEVKAEVLAARHDGTLRRTDYDDEAVQHARPASVRVARPILAEGLKAKRTGS